MAYVQNKPVLLQWIDVTYFRTVISWYSVCTGCKFNYISLTVLASMQLLFCRNNFGKTPCHRCIFHSDWWWNLHYTDGVVCKNIKHTKVFYYCTSFSRVWIKSVVCILRVKHINVAFCSLIKTWSSHVAILVIKCSFVYLALFKL